MSSTPWSFDGGRVRIDAAARLLIVSGEPAKLGGRAFDLLLALAEQRERVVTKGELLDRVWPGLVVEENNLRVHVPTLRKLEDEVSERSRSVCCASIALSAACPPVPASAGPRSGDQFVDASGAASTRRAARQLPVNTVS